GCTGRSHPTHAIIVCVSDPTDKAEITINITDCAETEAQITPPYDFKSDQEYDVTLTASGFGGGEQVEGVEGALFSSGNGWTASRLLPKWTLGHTLSLVLIVALIGVLGINLPPQIAFPLTLILLALFTTISGHAIVGRWLGLLIDERNKMSLSRLQMIL